MTDRVKEILSWYSADNPGTKANLARILNHGRLGGTGKIVVLPVDQGWEHGPARSFIPNPPSHDPDHHFQLALKAGCSAYAAPLGFLEMGAAEYASEIPLILKLTNRENLFSSSDPVQQVTATIDDALRLGCAAIGLTIYPGSLENQQMYEKARQLISAAKDAGLVAIVWSYARGSDISKDGETAVDVVAYAAHIACQLGAHVVKVKVPSEFIEQEKAEEAMKKGKVSITTLSNRVKYIVQSAFDGKRILIFSGGEATDDKGFLEEIKELKKGGSFGSIIGRNSFKRPMEDGVKLLRKVMDIYAGKK